MFFYAQIDSNNVVFAVSQLTNEVNAADMIRLASYDTTLLGKTRQADGTFV